MISARRLPGLDGIRAISITLVIAHHCFAAPGTPSLGLFDIFAREGAFGVDMFFVLSGFIITTLLLQEEIKSGSFSVSRFYLRRAIRILPPALFYLLVVHLLSFWKLTEVSLADVARAAFFIRNYVNGPWSTGHFWSLAIEEQFYLVLPF